MTTLTAIKNNNFTAFCEDWESQELMFSNYADLPETFYMETQKGKQLWFNPLKVEKINANPNEPASYIQDSINTLKAFWAAGDTPEPHVEKCLFSKMTCYGVNQVNAREIMKATFLAYWDEEKARQNTHDFLAWLDEDI